MRGNHNLEKSFPPKRIKDVDYLLKHYLEGIEVSKEDKRIKFILDDPNAPEMNFIKGVYVIYKKAVLELLEGSIPSIKVTSDSQLVFQVDRSSGLNYLYRE